MGIVPSSWRGDEHAASAFIVGAFSYRSQLPIPGTWYCTVARRNASSLVISAPTCRVPSTTRKRYLYYNLMTTVPEGTFEDLPALKIL